MNNFPITHDGKEYWVSRSIAVLCYVFTRINGKTCVLANKRGTGVDKTGLWNAPSGFLDYDETLKECACREVYEETGIKLSPRNLNLFRIVDNPNRKGQNVLIVFSTTFIANQSNKKTTTEHCEPNEVDEVKWIPLSKIDNYDWVSEEHKSRIKCAWSYEYYNEEYDEFEED